MPKYSSSDPTIFQKELESREVVNLDSSPRQLADRTIKSKSGTLYIVATPIGNLEDITLRAIRILKEVDVVACEDTRVSGKLLHHLNIKKTLISYHQHSKDWKTNKIIEILEKGESVALVTDSGTPGISDPAQKLVAEIQAMFCHSHSSLCHPREGGDPCSIKVIPIPGPSALSAAVSVSGLVEKEFYFAGFLPKKKGRQTEFKKLSVLKTPVVVYESALRVEKTLNDFREYFGEESKVFLAREITKMFEEYWSGNIKDVILDLKNHKIKGEFVLIVSF